MCATALSSIAIGDHAASWQRAGFLVEQSPRGAAVQLGSVAIRLTPGPEHGVRSLGYRIRQASGQPAPASSSDESIPEDLHGIALVADLAQGDRATSHPNGVTHIDHVVISSNLPEHTQASLECVGCVYRRTRTVGEGPGAVEQRFLWWGETLIELIGPAAPAGDEAPLASVWGLSLSTEDLERSAEFLGELLGPIKHAVQAGRSIATLRTGVLDISTRIALMSPHLTSGA